MICDEIESIRYALIVEVDGELSLAIIGNKDDIMNYFFQKMPIGADSYLYELRMAGHGCKGAKDSSFECVNGIYESMS